MTAFAAVRAAFAVAALAWAAGLARASAPTAAASAVTDSPGVPYLARLVARGFFAALLDGEVEAALPLCAPRVDFDGQPAAGAEALRARLDQISRRARSRQLRLHRLVLLSHADMHTRFGPPPARLRAAIRPGQLFALASFGGRGAVAVLARVGPFFRVVALTD